ncbi:hypothetical protein CORC01_13293 [Colletotrichum orchidophilum]|uniref:Uncharacterized protein n=1 Tax=Colletotrichum orchidophilum TaxID=1209926 RepID=A0A1G4AQH5_9PEZI|nr:uncharacterized protein CORC01_13293 [Colletotrichum orchidophilum]OHE91428.1 hypothetical protein CORC01_13293 [Colletotrichum orchidophilum]
MEIWAFANVYTASPRVSTVQSSSSTVTELPRICTWATENDASTSTAARTTSLQDTLASTHRFWNATIDHNSSNISTITSITTMTSADNVEPSWTYHRPTMHTTAAIPVSAATSHGASCSHFSALFVFFLAVSFWDRLG